MSTVYLECVHNANYLIVGMV